MVAGKISPVEQRARSIAVLPFFNMSGNPKEDYFAEGMADEIITALSRYAWLFVIGRNSSFTYKGKAVDSRQVMIGQASPMPVRPEAGQAG